MATGEVSSLSSFRTILFLHSQLEIIEIRIEAKKEIETRREREHWEMENLREMERERGREGEKREREKRRGSLINLLRKVLQRQ